MIKIVINPDSDHKTLVFDKKEIVIGFGSSDKIDLPIFDDKLQETHVKIFEQNNRMIATNNANDPFTTCNGLPFGKRPLKEGDYLQIGKTTIRFEKSHLSNIQETKPQENLLKVFEKQAPPIKEIAKQEIIQKTAETVIEKTEIELICSASKLTDFEPHQSPGVESSEDPLDCPQPEIEGLCGANTQFMTVDNHIEKEIDLSSIILSQEISHQSQNGQPLQETDLCEPQPLNVPVEASLTHQSESIDPPTSNLIPIPSFRVDSSNANTLTLSLGTQPLGEKTHETAVAQKEDPVDYLQPPNEFFFGTKAHLVTVDNIDEESEKSSNDYDNNKETKESSPSYYPFWSWNFLLLLITSILIVAILTTIFFYMKALNKNETDKIKASEGVADVAMALTYAQVNQIKPQKQNWFDPEFIKNNLASVISTNSPSLANIDTHGQFSNCPYILRVYTNSDLSQFLVIAQPEPELINWLIPKTAIVVDSTTMEMRAINDFKALNRLLVNPNVLNGENATEISTLVKQGLLIPLSTLDALNNGQDFSPPKTLSLVRPGAENLIYNAPRYYNFGETLMTKALSLIQTTGRAHEISRLQQEIEGISKYPNMILYSSKGVQAAIQGQKALITLVPQCKFLTAYLNFNTKSQVSGSQLLFDTYPDQNPLAELAPTLSSSSSSSCSINANTSDDQTNDLESETEIQSPATDIEQQKQIHNSALNVNSSHEIDRNHPLFLELSTLLLERQNNLKQISKNIHRLLQSNNEGIIDNFDENLQDLLLHYKEIDLNQQKRIKKELLQLYQKYSDISLSQIMIYVRAIGLETFVQKNVTDLAEQFKKQPMIEQEIPLCLDKIKNANSLEELDDCIKETTPILNLENLPDPDKLMEYQNKMHVEVLRKLNQFILAPNQTHSAETFTTEHLERLDRILKSAWVNDPNEYQFYLTEFELLSQKIQKTIPPTTIN